MPKPASKTTRVILGCLCLLGLALGLFWCGRKAQISRQEDRAVERAKNEARLVIVNESNCEWQITLWPVQDDEGRQWRIPVGKSVEETLPARAYRVEQKLIAEVGAVQTRRLDCVLAGGQSYRWRLVNLLSADEAEWTLPREGVEAR